MILGFAIGIMVSMILFDIWQPCQMHHGPDSNIVKRELYQADDGTCYQFILDPVICPI